MIPETHFQAACCDLVAGVVRCSGSASLKVTGLSILPAIRLGDVLSIERHAANELRSGKIILFSGDGRLTAHRIVSMAGGYLLRRSDRLTSCDLPVHCNELIGRVASVRRDGHAVCLKQSF
jgi:hypothetical protein